MPDKNQTAIYNWVCRILLIIHFSLCIAGYVDFLGTKDELISPLIPQSTIDLIATPYLYTSICLTASFVLAICLYLFRKKVWTIFISSVSIIMYKFLLLYFTN